MVDADSVHHSVVMACGYYAKLLASLPSSRGSDWGEARDHNCGTRSSPGAHMRIPYTPTPTTASPSTAEHLKSKGNEVPVHDSDARGSQTHPFQRTNPQLHMQQLPLKTPLRAQQPP